MDAYRAISLTLLAGLSLVAACAPTPFPTPTPSAREGEASLLSPEENPATSELTVVDRQAGEQSASGWNSTRRRTASTKTGAPSATPLPQSSPTGAGPTATPTPTIPVELTASATWTPTPNLADLMTQAAPSATWFPIGTPTSLEPLAPQVVKGVPVGLYELVMIDELRGWALGLTEGDDYQRVLRTADAGYSWRDVTPPEPLLAESSDFKSFSYARAAFLDHRRAWVIYRGSLTVWRTSNGGATWYPSRDLPIVGKEEGDDFNDAWRAPMGIGFSDPENGWVTMNENQAMFQGDLELLTTQDGGFTWKHVFHTTIVNYDDMLFIDRKNGWFLGGDIFFSVESLYRTWDGGSTWARFNSLNADQEGTLFEKCRATCPIEYFQWFPASRLVMVVAPAAAEGIYDLPGELYYSRDLGQTWIARPLPADSARSSYSVDFVDAWMGWLFVERTRTLYQTRLGGWSWDPVYTGLWVGEIEFVSRSRGWALAWAGWEPEPDVRHPEDRILLRTMNGGADWLELRPVLVSD